MTRQELLDRRAKLEAALMDVEAKLAALDAPKTRGDVKWRINIWKAALKFLDATEQAHPASADRIIAIKRAFRHVRDSLDKEPVLGKSLATWAKMFVADEQESGSTAATRLKFAHLAQTHIREFKERTKPRRVPRGSPVDPYLTPLPKYG